jgi:hypothetical protein
MLWLVNVALVATTQAESPTSAPRATVPSETRLSVGGQTVTTDSSSVASARMSLRRIREPGVDPYAEYISVGPLGSPVPQAPMRGGGMTVVMEPPHRRLRVTISSAEGTVLLTIDDILTGRADSRSLTAQYRISPYLEESTRGLWTALLKAPRVLGTGPTGPPITWLSPTSFAWTTRADTIVFEQEADSIFTMTVQVRLR